ncbi:excinuclease ABC subunit UvrA [Clostridium estertheticum]|uniref:ATP-binding cassette domain-containing protein n=1 Tax=Clostridium estertheticum TaxID=238834 RepID=UPI0013EE7FA4|nr:excinuclease ABC subunit UvrA [Clostridium estertheticum]MBZ9607179.1 excinuclease ABC subunit UvrA [Clostridium estertheticum]
MKEEFIILKGCRENNLKNVSLNIPKRKITIFTGVSGSGKTSIVFDTIGKEAKRQLNETFSAFIRNFLPKYGEVKAEYIGNLSTPIIIDQKRIGASSRSTLGTITDINPFIRMLFSRIAIPHIAQRNKFSFNDISGMCPECEGLGMKLTVDMDQIVDKNKSINEGAILLSGFGIGSWPWKIFAESGFFDNDKKLCDYTDEELEKFLYGPPEKIKVNVIGTMNITYEGLILKFNRSYLNSDKEMSEASKKKLSKLTMSAECPLCHGKRLNQEALSSLINGYNISDFMSMQIDELINVIDEINFKEVSTVIESIKEKLNNIIDIGLGYLTLDRETSTLSGGESQRIKMVKHLNSNLIDLLYIFDEPSIGLHPRDVHKLNDLLQKLRDKGNTVIVVEHDPDVIKIADYVVDVGPYAGTKGGNIVFEGSYDELLTSGTLTGNALKSSLSIKKVTRKPNGYLEVNNCNTNNLKNISVKVPKGVLTVITGVAGSGKSTLMKQEFPNQNKDVILIDQSAVSANSRSSLATYGGIMDNIRKVFAKDNNVNASLFSYNSKGACENCNGTGIIETNLAFMENTKNTCEECAGKRFKKEVLEYTIQDQTIIDVLDMTVSEALVFFNNKQIKTKLQSIEEMGIGYLTLGQTLDTLSGGECQRLKLANELHKNGSIYVMDEPSTGLHMSDIEKFIGIVENIVDNGNTVIIIEHNMDIIRSADWIIDLGPEGGIRGGNVIFEGTPLELTKCKESLTAKYI